MEPCLIVEQTITERNIFFPSAHISAVMLSYAAHYYLITATCLGSIVLESVQTTGKRWVWISRRSQM